MTKGKAKPAVVIPPKPVLNPKGNVFTSSKGVDIPIKAVSQFKLDAMRTSRDIPQPPTYEAEVLGGEKELLPLDAESAKNKGREDEWKQYLADVEIERNAYGKRFNTLITYEGVDLEPPGEDSEWQVTCDALGLKVPTNPVERKVFYVNTEMMGIPEDMGNLVTAIFEMSKFSPEVISEMKATFRAIMERKANKPVGTKEVGVADK
jgi:hypothetical protein